MGKALYRTYRSTSFDEVLGQEHITTTLKNALNNGHINHAYLFTGPRGVGKTSVARILAHAVNGLEYHDDDSHIDIIEIDAASNRRIDEIRELRSRVMVAPTSSKYKVYIIDEVHMLTREAFNALLKTLEEPPDHAIFILATTEFHKLPDTIVSRCLRFNFKPIEAATAVKHLQHIAQSEGVEIDDAALRLIAEHGDGSFRDSISRLDQMRGNSGKLSAAYVERMLGVAPQQKVSSLLESVLSGDPAQLIAALADLYSHGADPGLIAKQLSDLLRAELLSTRSRIPHDLILRVLKELLEVQSASRAKSWLELTLLDCLLKHSPQIIIPQPDVTVSIKKTESITKQPANIAGLKQINELSPLPHPEKGSMPTPVQVDEPSTTAEHEIWSNVLASIKTKNNTLYSIARMAEPQLINGTLVITFGFAFHHKQISEPRNKDVISDMVRTEYPDIAGIEFKLAGKNTVAAKSSHKQSPEIGKVDPAFSSITNIFGGAEVLES